MKAPGTPPPSDVPSAKRTAGKLGVVRHRDFSSLRRYSGRQANAWLAFAPCARATQATDAPGAKISSTI